MPTPTPIPTSFEALLDYLKRSRGFDFVGYKRTSLMRRIQKRMQMVAISDFGEYMDHLEVHPEEFARLFNTILINVTAFFRDATAWDYLAQEVIPHLVAGKEPDAPIRVWSAGCASGEEAYTAAMVLAEAVGLEQFKRRVKVYATDADEDALAQARQAAYSVKDVQTIPAELRERYFEQIGGRYVFRQDLRRSVIFGRHDLIQDAPISRLDLLICRNTLMYLNADTQGRILARLHFALNDTGYLFLGKAEMLLTHANVFTPVELKHRIFSKLPRTNLRDRLLLLAQTGDAEEGNHLARQVRLREAAFETGAVAQVVMDANGILTLANEAARTLFALGPKDLGRPFKDLELSYRPVELRSLIEQAYAEHRIVALDEVERHLPDGAMQYLDVRVAPLQANGGPPLGVGVTFTDVTRTRRLQEELRRSSQELETAYEELQSTNEELETTNEELQSSNEELETTNEELQSSNEELETMNEELQSTNEELQTLNDELRQRTDEFTQTNVWLQSALAILPAGLVVVDHDFNVVLWNRHAEEMWGLRSEEVRGRSFLGLDIGLPVEPLRGLIRACLEQGGEQPPVLLDATNRRGKAIRCQVKTSLFDTPTGGGADVALLIEDVTERERLTAAAQAARDLAEGIIATVREPLIVLDGELKVVSANPAFYRAFQTTPETTMGQLLYHLGDRQWDIPALRRLLGEILPAHGDFHDFMVEHDFPAIGHKAMLLNARRIVREGHPATQLILLAMEDVTGRQ